MTINLLLKYYSLKESSESTLMSLENKFKRLANDGWEVNISHSSVDDNMFKSLISQPTEYSESISDLSNSVECKTKTYKSYIAILNDGESFSINGLYDKDSNDFKTLSDLNIQESLIDCILEINYIESETDTDTDLKPDNSISVQVYSKEKTNVD